MLTMLCSRALHLEQLYASLTINTENNSSMLSKTISMSHVQIRKRSHQISKWPEPRQVSKNWPRQIMFCVLRSVYSNVQSEAEPTQHYPLTSSYLVVLYSLAAHPPCRPAAPWISMESLSSRVGLCVGCWVKQVTSWLLRPRNSATPLCLQMQRCRHMPCAEEITP